MREFGFEVDKFNTKEAEGTPTPEPEVVEAVKKEIEKLGDNTKASYDKLNHAHAELLKEVDKLKGKDSDAIVESKLTKLTEDITTRQNDLDTKLQEALDAEKTKLTTRIDQLELALKRPSFESTSVDRDRDRKLVEQAKNFFIDVMVVGRPNEFGKGITKERIEAMDIDVKEYEQYIKSFNYFLRKDEKLITPDHMKSLQVGIDPDGGQTVVPAMSSSIVKRLYEADPLRDLASNETITTGSLELLVDYDEADAGWEAETIAGPETGTPKLNKKSIPVHVLYAKPKATQTLLEDSAINIENWLGDKVANKFIRTEGPAYINGDGVGKPRGFLTYANGTDFGEIERTNMGHATQLTTDGFINVKYSLIEEYLNRGTWLMNRLTVADAMKLKDGEGNYIWKPGITTDANSTLLGLPVRMSTTMPTVAAGALSIALADWRETYMIVDRLGITVQRDPFTAKPFVEFYVRKRVGGDVKNYQSIKIGIVAA